MEIQRIDVDIRTQEVEHLDLRTQALRLDFTFPGLITFTAAFQIKPWLAALCEVRSPQHERRGGSGVLDSAADMYRHVRRFDTLAGELERSYAGDPLTFELDFSLTRASVIEVLDVAYGAVMSSIDENATPVLHSYLPQSAAWAKLYGIVVQRTCSFTLNDSLILRMGDEAGVARGVRAVVARGEVLC